MKLFRHRRERDKFKQEAQVYEFIKAYIETHKFAPSYKNIADGCFISIANVSLYIERLELQGYLTRVPNLARSISLTDKEYEL